jgi:hypothetical protein
MEAHELFVGVEISSAGAAEQDAFGRGWWMHHRKLYTAEARRVPGTSGAAAV